MVMALTKNERSNHTAKHDFKKLLESMLADIFVCCNENFKYS